MANNKSQIKRIKTNEIRRQRNKAGKAALKTEISGFRAAVESKDKKAAEESLGKVIKKIDVAASKGFIHKNNAANKKSSLAKAMNSL